MQTHVTYVDVQVTSLGTLRNMGEDTIESFEFFDHVVVYTVYIYIYIPRILE